MTGRTAGEPMTVVLGGSADSDLEEIETHTLELRERLLELDVEQVALRRSDTVPQGAKPGEVIALGALVVTVAPIALRSVVGLLEKWIEHRPVRTVVITLGEDSLELESVSSADQRRLIDVFVARHAPEAEPPASPAPVDPPPDPTASGDATTGEV
ncbi:hypothetical protein [Streptomyces sp. NPDC057690]|uniref:hypothetical protein n=1 Tax=Streptomyces sp. NPDC057690 TaxID=3346214 RepID=UPI003693B7AC